MTESDTPDDPRAAERRPLRHEGGWPRVGAAFVVSLLFYLAVGGFAGWYDAVTGLASAAVTAALLGRVALGNGVGVRTLHRLGRTCLFVPFLLWEVVKANVGLAAVILHPSLPVDPQVFTVEVDTEDDLERAFFANCVTLTPGTVILDIRGREYHVHALTGAAVTDLASGRLARAVGWVFGHEEGERGESS